MAEFRVIVSDPKSGVAYQMDISGVQANALIGKRIGDEFDGTPIGLTGYTLKVTGGSDRDGFSMRPEIEGPIRRKLLVATKGVGYKPKKKGLRRRKTFRGNEISAEIYQVNIVVVKHGKKSLAKLLGVEAEETKEAEGKGPEDVVEEAVAE
ncbi:MAG: 30S ribosomal protein S6e [Methermicoccaceae archaeon]